MVPEGTPPFPLGPSYGREDLRRGPFFKEAFGHFWDCRVATVFALTRPGLGGALASFLIILGFVIEDHYY
jgi:hypothetical protein